MKARQSDQPDRVSTDEHGLSDGTLNRGRRPGRKRRIAKLSALILLVPIVLLLVVGGVLLYLYQGQRINNETVNAQVQGAIQSVVGDAYRVEIGNTGLALVSSSLLSLQGSSVQIIDNSDNAVVASLEEVEVGLEPLSIFAESFRFSQLLIDGGTFDLSSLKAETSGALGLSENLTLIARQAAQASQPFSSGMIEGIVARNITIKGLDLGRNAPSDPVRIQNLQIEGTPENGLMINAISATSLSNPVIAAQWSPASGETPGELTAGIGPVNSLEFLSHADPIMALAEDQPKGVGLQTSFRADLRIFYDEAFRAVEPFMKIQADGGEFRIGKNQTTSLNHLVANVRADFERELLILEQADVSLGPLAFSASGLLKLPDQDSQNTGLPFNLSLIDFESSDPLWKDDNPLEAAVLDAVYTPQSRQLDIASLRLTDRSGNRLMAVGSAHLPDGVSPAVDVTIESSRMPVAFLQNAWPFNLAPPVRNWLRNQLSGGTIEDLNVTLNVGEGRLGEVEDGGGLTDNEFAVAARLSGTGMPTTGDLPPLRQLQGNLKIAGSELVLGDVVATMQRQGDEPVEISDAALVIDNIFDKPPLAKLEARISAPVGRLAALASAKPLEIPQRIALKPSALSGDAALDLSLSFPLVKEIGPETLDWTANVDLKNAASSEPVFGQTIQSADIEINAVPKLLNAKGTATVNGFKAKLELSEPLNGGDASKRKRKVSATLTTKQLAAQGIDLNPIVSGSIGVQINTGSNGADRYEIDLTNADLELPWISWSKGAGRQSKAGFTLEQKGGTNTLKDFSISGPAYQAKGTLSFNKTGLLSANLQNVALVRGDSFDVSVSSKSGRYTINANGRAFDGRAIINKVIHGDGFSGGGAGSDVSVIANFGRLVGFNQQVMENALVRYESTDGRLNVLEVKGAISGHLSTINAGAQGERTTFNFESRNAGVALAIVDIYRKMEGGRLKSSLTRTGNGPFVGKVKIEKFTVIGEERLKSLIAAPPENNRLQRASGKLRELDVQRVRFDDMEAKIEKAEDLLVVREGRIRNQQIGLTFDGTLFDPSDQMSVRGTFMPLFAVSRLIGGIPIIGDILSNGKNSGLIGITYRLKGPSGNPSILVNPVSIIAPGIFRQIFQFQE